MSGSIVQFRPTIGYNFEQLTVSTSVQVLTPSKYMDSLTSGGACNAYLTIENGDVRYTYDGTTPTSTVGHILQAGGSIVLSGQNQIGSFKCFRIGAVNAVLSITYERE
jgi:hypothetical protein